MTATMPTSTAMKPCRLYRFYVAHPITGKRVLGYVGETWQMPFDRLMQHVRDQPWADTMLGWELDPVIYYGKAAVLEAEVKAIRLERPLYNVRGNEQNRQRVIPPEAIRQRRARDAAKGALRWVHPDDLPGGQPPVPRQRPVGSTRQARAQAYRVWQYKVWAAASALIAVTVSAGCRRYEVPAVWWQELVAGVVVGPLLLWWSVRRRLDSWRLWRRRICRARRLLR